MTSIRFAKWVVATVENNLAGYPMNTFHVYYNDQEG